MTGTNPDENNKLWDYIDYKTGQVVKVRLEELMNKLASDVVILMSDPLSIVFPFLKEYPLFDPIKSIQKNSDTFYEAVRYYCDNCSDKDTVFNQIMALGTIKREDAYYDIGALISAGMDTTSHLISSSLFFIQKFDKQEKLINQMKESELDVLKKKNLSEKELSSLYEKINNCDYLNYTIKEALRLDAPSSFGIKYIAKKNIKICDVPIPKDTLISLFLLGPHHDSTQWHKPTEFIPERFDPESEYFDKPGEPGKMRHPDTLVPFSIGTRVCPGKSLAVFEAKVVISRLLHTIEYEVDQDLWNDGKARFNVHSQFRVHAKILKK